MQWLEIEKKKSPQMNDHISKPIDVEAVFETLAKWIEAPLSNSPSKNQVSEPSIEIDFSTLENVNTKEGSLVVREINAYIGIY